MFTACLKTQLGTNTMPNIQTVEVDINQAELSSFSVDQIAVASLLQFYFKIEDSELLQLVQPDESDTNWLGYVGADSQGSLTSFNETTLRSALKSLYADTPAPPEWGMTMDQAIDSVDVSLLSDFTLDMPPRNKYTEVLNNHNRCVLSIHRCTQAEIDDLNAEGNSYTDMFGLLQDQIDFGVSNSNLDSSGYRKALYDAESDTIVFRSNFAIEVY